MIIGIEIFIIGEASVLYKKRFTSSQYQQSGK